ANPPVGGRLRRLWEQEELPDGQRRRIGLALLPADPQTVRGRLMEMMLQTDDPHEMLLLRDGLAAHAEEIRAGLWDEARRPATADSRRFLLLVALAAFDPDSANWPAVAGPFAEQILAANP